MGTLVVKVLVHDYAGHPFQVHLSRHLATRGHDVTHAYFVEDPGPKGMLHCRQGDPPTLQFVPITIGRHYDKSSLLARRFNDMEYGRRAARIIRDLKPDVVISGNTPTEAQAAIVAECKAVPSGFVYWLQDFYSIAVSMLLRKQLGNAGRLIGLYYRWLERYQLRNSDAVVIISEDFRALASVWAGSDAKVRTITNWAALEDIPVCTKENNWSREHALHTEFTFVYSGTLALKHNPDLLVRLAQNCGPRTLVVVVAQGAGMKHLEDAKAKHRLDSLRLLPLQPIARFPEVLATGDVLVAVIEADAGTYSVPSKVQSYLCAGRSILVAAPRENLAARVVARENAGIVVAPDGSDFMAAAIRLRHDNELRAQQGANGRAYAERAFDMIKIVDAFEETLCSAIPSKSFNSVRRTGAGSIYGLQYSRRVH
jgi:colanic acid biosynthesis glycosyl transferase WcaI